MTVAVTGATGFLGRRLVRLLVENGMHVRCAVRPTSDVESLRAFVPAGSRRQLEIVPTVLTDGQACRRLLDGCEIVYHLAAALRGGAASLFFSTVIPTRCLIDAACDSNLRRFVLVSSLGVYAAGELRRGAVLDEECPVDPLAHLRDPYTYSKVVQEEVTWEAYAKRGLPLVVVRPGVIYGCERGCLSNRIGLRLGNLVLRMGGRHQLPYTFVENCAEATMLAGIADNAEGQAINIVDDSLPTGREVLKRVRRAGERIRVLPVPGWAVKPLSYFSERYHTFSKGQLPAVLTRHRSAAMWKPLRYSNAKAKSLLGWTPRISFADALQQTRMTIS